MACRRRRNVRGVGESESLCFLSNYPPLRPPFCLTCHVHFLLLAITFIVQLAFLLFRLLSVLRHSISSFYLHVLLYISLSCDVPRFRLLDEDQGGWTYCPIGFLLVLLVSGSRLIVRLSTRANCKSPRGSRRFLKFLIRSPLSLSRSLAVIIIGVGAIRDRIR